MWGSLSGIQEFYSPREEPALYAVDLSVSPARQVAGLNRLRLDYMMSLTVLWGCARVLHLSVGQRYDNDDVLGGFHHPLQILALTCEVPGCHLRSRDTFD